MNAIVEQILKETEEDFVKVGLQKRHDNIAEKARRWFAAKDKLLPVCKAFQALGGDVRVDAEGDLIISVAGDKELFVKAWKLLRSVGIRLRPAEAGATFISQIHHAQDMLILFQFSSTVCRRVKVGTKMVEQDVYETQCGPDLNTVDMKQLEAEVTAAATPALEGGDIPF